MRLSSVAVCLSLIVATGCVGSAEVDSGQRRTEGEAIAASCVKQYAPEGLATQEFGFEGLATAIRPQTSDESAGFGEIDFRVTRWFKGQARESVTLKAPVPIGDGAVSSVDFPVIREGERYLVSGESDFAHACGFTRLYTDADAEVWAGAF